jgi:hypothetical protein
MRRSSTMDAKIPLASYALNYVAKQLGFNSSPVRVGAGVFPDDRNLVGSLVGSPRGRRAASPGMWLGHLVVSIGDDWLLVPLRTATNALEGCLKPRPWAADPPKVTPAHGRLPNAFSAPSRSSTGALALAPLGNSRCRCSTAGFWRRDHAPEPLAIQWDSLDP